MNSLLCRSAQLAALATIGATLVTGCASSNGTPAPPAAHKTARPTPVTMRFQGKPETGNLAMEDLGAKSAPGGPDIGDVLAFTQSLTQNGKPAGQAHVIGIGVDHRRHLTEVTGTLSLSTGTVQVAGVVSQAPSFSLTVTGGTGSYARVTGTVEFKNDNNAQMLTVHLFKPVA